MIEIREMTKLEDFQACVEIQREVWGFDDPFDAVPLPLLIVSERNDGIVLGAYDKDRMIGFVYSLPGIHEGQKVQWSHMLAVLDPYRNSDIGFRLKKEQYEIAQQKGYDVVEWTYDPLESRNAYFNLVKLGCIAKEYELNIYGETSSPLHAGMPTDRFVAHWQIPPLQKTHPKIELPQPPALITRTRVENHQRFIEEVELQADGEFLYVEIPENIQALKNQSRDGALQWRLKTRDIFVHYFGAGYVAYSFLHRKDLARSFYVLKLYSISQVR